MEAFIHSLDVRMWEVVSNKYTVSFAIPTNADEKTKYELDKRARFAILCGLSKEVFVKVMYFKSANEVWTNLESIYQGDEKVKESKLITLKNQFDALKMNNDETVASYFLRIDEIVNARKGLGEEIDEHDVVAKVVRTLLPKFETKISALEEKKHFSQMTMHKLQSILIAYEMRIGNTLSTSKETTFKVEKQEDSESELSDVFEALLVRKLKKKFQGKFKCFGCGKIGHFAAKCPYLDLSKDEDKYEKSFKKPWNPNKRLNNFKKKNLMTKEDSEDESDESNEDVDLEEELLCALQEVKRLKKFVTAYDDSNKILQLDLVNANKVIETQKRLIEDKEQEISKLQKQVYTLENQKHFEVTTEKGETSHQNFVAANRNQFPNNRFFHGYCHFCNLFGHKVNTCRFTKTPTFGHKQFFGAIRNIRCFTCFQYGHTSNYCKMLQRPAKVWRPKLEQSMLVQTTLISTKSAIWVLDIGCSHHMIGDKNKFSILENHPGGFVKFGDNTGLYITGTGTVMINKDTPINDVYYVEGLKYNLLSISQICDSGHQVVFNSYSCVIKKKSGKIIANGLRTPDKGGEFTSQDFIEYCEKHGIKRQYSATRTPQQNGVVERKNRTVKEMARTMLNESNLSHKYWKEAVHTTVYILNRVQIRIRTACTPYELWHGKTTSVKHLRIFRCKCYIKNDSDYLDSFQSKSDEESFSVILQIAKLISVSTNA
ncbi:uncharacterized protein LOC131070384 [Cryptomeria japonica]|uniref:uncharacterized protein LOC131070384 n=1 Tax=Cryptomeria japonica TaxID=3369 RepID=UPI0027DAB102|nr:uncharacterized protein LOC131070384 [Cryptomeria japonica]